MRVVSFDSLGKERNTRNAASDINVKTNMHFFIESLGDDFHIYNKNNSSS